MDERKATIASNLIKLRLAAGMTQAELGEKLNYSDKSISKWERGDVTTDVFVLMQIAEIFGVDVDYLLKPHNEIEPVIYGKPDRSTYTTDMITLVAILDADKEGFLRSATSLIQTIGRAARNAEGHVIMYADTITDSMREALDETNRRREIQMKYNEEHGITPQTIKKAVRDLISISRVIAKEEVRFEKDPESMTKKELEKLIGDIQKKMQKAAADLNFEAAAELRDKMLELKKQLNDME